MAISNYSSGDVQSFPAAVDMDLKVGFFVKIDSSGDADLAVAADTPDGVIVNVEKAGVGAMIGVMTTAGRLVPIAVGTAVSAGANISSDAAGKGITAVTTTFPNIVAIAIDAGAADGDLVTGLFGYKGSL